MFSLSHACHGVSRLPAAGFQVPEKGAPWRWRLRGPARTAGKHKAWPSSQQRSVKGGNYSVMAGHYLPAGWDTATSRGSPWRGSPSTQREQSPTWPQPSSLMHSGAKDGQEQAALGSAESRSWTKTSVSVSVQIPNQQNTTADQGTLGFLK